MDRTVTLTHFLQDVCSASGSAPQLVYRDRTLCFAQLSDESARVARGLRELGVGCGDRVALWLPNTPAWLAAFFACARLGAIAGATNTRFRSAEMEDILGRSEAKVLIYWPAFRGIDFSAILEQLHAGSVSALRAIVAYGEPGDPPPPERVHGIAVHRYEALAACTPMTSDHASAETGCLTFTTSGTTKAPKFVLHSHRSIVRHARDVARGFKYVGADTVGLSLLPFCGTFGFSTALAPLAAGKPLVIESAFEGERAVDLIRRHRVTNTNLTGHMIAELLAQQTPPDAFSSIRFCGCGSGAGDIVEKAAERGLRVSGVYGSSEVQALFSHHDDFGGPLAERALGGGWPVSSLAQVRARDISTGMLLPHGEAGEIEIAAPSLLTEYLGDPQATREAIAADGSTVPATSGTRSPMVASCITPAWAMRCGCRGSW